MAADAHFKFVSIHPFVDGNGRCGRLLMNLILIKSGFPPAIIRKEDRKEYISAIEKGQLTGDMNDYYEIIYKAVDRSFEIYFQILDEKKKQVRKDDKLLLKIGQLAKITKETVPTIRFWTNQGLLKVREFSQGGYQLFDKSMVKRVEKIRNLQKKERLTIEEIKRRLEK